MKAKMMVLLGSLGLALFGTGAETAPFGSVVGWWRFNDASNPGKDSSEYGNDLDGLSSVTIKSADTGYTTRGCYDDSGCLYIGTAGNTATATPKRIWDETKGLTYLMRMRNDGGSIEVTSWLVDKEVKKVTAEISDKSTWHLISMRYDNQKVTGGTNKYYYWLFGDNPLLAVDSGLAQAVSNDAGKFPISTAIALGGTIGASSKSMNYKGYMDDVCVVQRTMTKDEINYYYNYGDPNPYLTGDSSAAFASASGWSCSGEGLGYAPITLPGADFQVDNGFTLTVSSDGTFSGHSLLLGRSADLASVVNASSVRTKNGNLTAQANLTFGDLRLYNGKLTGSSGKTLTATKLVVNASAMNPYEINVASGTYKVTGVSSGSGVLAKTGAGMLDLTELTGTAKLRLAEGSIKTPRLDGYTGGTVIVDGDAVTFTGADTLSGTIQVRYDGTIAAAEASYPVLNAPTLTSAGQVAISAAIPEKYEGAPKLENGVVSLVVTKKVAPLPDEDKGTKPVLLWQ